MVDRNNQLLPFINVGYAIKIATTINVRTVITIIWIVITVIMAVRIVAMVAITTIISFD